MDPAELPWPLDTLAAWFATARDAVVSAAGTVMQVWSDWSVPIVVVAVLVTVAAVAARQIMVRRALAGRCRYLVLPTADLDATSRDVYAFGKEVEYARRLIRHRLAGKRASAIRISIESGPNGYLTYWRSGPRTARDLLSRPQYRGEEIIAAADADLDSLAEMSPPPAPGGAA